MSMELPIISNDSSGMGLEHVIGIIIILLLAVDVYLEYQILLQLRGQGGTIRNENDARYHMGWHGGVR